MKILVATGLFPPEEGGSATYAKLLKDTLPGRGVEVTVLPFSRVRKYPKFIRHIVYFFLLVRRSKGQNCIYALDAVSVGLPARLAAFFTRKPLVLKIVGDYAWEQGRQRFGITELLDDFLKKDRYPFRVSVLRHVQTFVARGARGIIVPSEYLKKVVVSWGIPKERITVIYNAAPVLGNLGHKNVLRGILKYHGKYVVTAARLVAWKGVREVIDAVVRASANGPETRLLIIGDGPERDRLEAYAEKNSVEGQVRFAGRLPHDVTLAYIKAADAFVLNSGYEGFSHLLLEALALGTPTVTTTAGGNPEIITHAKHGLLVPYKDTTMLAKAVARILTDEPLRRTVRDAGKRRVSKFSRERMLKETKAYLEKCI